MLGWEIQMVTLEPLYKMIGVVIKISSCIFSFLQQANLSTSTQTHYDLPWDLALRIQFAGVFRGSYAIMMDSHGPTSATIMKVKICSVCPYCFSQWLRFVLFCFWKTKSLKFCLSSFFSHIFSYPFCCEHLCAAWRRMTSWETGILTEVSLFLVF